MNTWEPVDKGHPRLDARTRLGVACAGRISESHPSGDFHAAAHRHAQARGRLRRIPARLARALRAGEGGISRRGDARQPQDATVSHLRRARRGGLQVGRGRQPLHRLLDGPRRASLWAQPAPHPRLCERGRTPGFALRGESRAGSGMGRMGATPRALRRTGAIHGFGHRGDAHGAETRARLHGQKARGQVRGPFPRLARGARNRCARPLRERTRSGTT